MPIVKLEANGQTEYVGVSYGEEVARRLSQRQGPPRGHGQKRASAQALVETGGRMSRRKTAGNPFARVRANMTDEEISTIAAAHGMEPMTAASREHRAKERRMQHVLEALAEHPAKLEAWLVEGEKLTKKRSA